MEPTANQLAESPDAGLMQAAAAGDHAAFRLLVERHADRVRGTLFRMLPTGGDVDDLAQEVFLRVWKAAPRYRETAKFTTWLMTITRNVVFNETRRLGRATLLPADAEEPSAEIRRLCGPADQHPDQAAQAAEVRSAVDRALRELPEKQRLALVLHRYEGMPHEEVAKVLGTSVPSVKSLIFRAKEALRISLGAFLAREQA